MERFKFFDGIAHKYRQHGQNTKIWLGRFDFQLRIKNKDDYRKWSEIPPFITPENMPLFNVGKMTVDTIREIRDDELERRNRILEQNQRLSATYKNIRDILEGK